MSSPARFAKFYFLSSQTSEEIPIWININKIQTVSPEMKQNSRGVWCPSEGSTCISYEGDEDAYTIVNASVEEVIRTENL